jgi:hypothetical protein
MSLLLILSTGHCRRDGCQCAADAAPHYARIVVVLLRIRRHVVLNYRVRTSARPVSNTD